MPRHDRLSALIARFSLQVSPADGADANLVVFAAAADGAPTRMVFSPGALVDEEPDPGEDVVFRARADWGGSANPLVSALPGVVELEVGNDPDTAGLARLLIAEGENRRCGSETVLNRLGEVLMVRLMRARIEGGSTESGLLGGLADPRLSRAIVAMHEDPGRHWRSDDLAAIAGLSISRFAELFARVVGVTPMSYLRRWRMVLARQDIERGDRIQAVARRYGYGSSEALNRSFRRQFGDSPIRFRRSAPNGQSTAPAAGPATLESGQETEHERKRGMR